LSFEKFQLNLKILSSSFQEGKVDFITYLTKKVDKILPI
jgi:hypothetical protein